MLDVMEAEYEYYCILPPNPYRCASCLYIFYLVFLEPIYVQILCGNRVLKVIVVVPQTNWLHNYTLSPHACVLTIAIQLLIKTQHCKEEHVTLGEAD
jgi:hypothetical protein